MALGSPFICKTDPLAIQERLGLWSRFLRTLCTDLILPEGIPEAELCTLGRCCVQALGTLVIALSGPGPPPCQRPAAGRRHLGLTATILLRSCGHDGECAPRGEVGQRLEAWPGSRGAVPWSGRPHHFASRPEALSFITSPQLFAPWLLQHLQGLLPSLQPLPRGPDTHRERDIPRATVQVGLWPWTCFRVNRHGRSHSLTFPEGTLVDTEKA